MLGGWSHSVSWQDLGSIGELVSAVAVVISLIYLAFQIRQNTSQIDQNTKAVRASAIDSSIGRAMASRQAIIETEDVARIYHTGNSAPESLSEHELLRYRLLLHNVFWAIWNIYSQSRFADLPAETWASQIPLIQRLLSSEGGTWFWDNYGHEFEQSFQAEVEAIVNSPSRAGGCRPPAA